MVAAVTAGGGVTTMAIKVPHPTPSADRLTTAVNIRSCMPDPVSLNSYTTCVECSVLC
jgi:hypothetical protein